MSVILNDWKICKSILRETALIILEAEERDKNLGNKEAWKISVPTYVGKIILILVIFFEVNLSYLRNWDHSRSGLANKGPKISLFALQQ